MLYAICIQHLFEQPPLTDFLFLYLMFKQELTLEEIAQRKAARKRFREIVKQRWQEETLKNLSKKALKKLNKYPDSPLSLGEGKGVRTPEPTLTEAINGLIINKHLNK